MITLEKIIQEEIAQLWHWRNENRVFFVDQRKVSVDDQERWFSKYLKTITDYMYMIREDTYLVGCIGLVFKNGEPWINRVMLGDKGQAHRGIMSEALQILMEQFGFHTYYLGVLKTNNAAINFYKKNGFSVWGEEDECYIMKIER